MSANPARTERQAAEHLGFAPATIRHSRWSGTLGGIPAPRHIKLGRNVRYLQADLDQWLAKAAGEVSA